jgi:hypothetical protein
MNHNAAPDDSICTAPKREHVYVCLETRISAGIHNQVGHITRMPFGTSVMTVRLAPWIKVALRTGGIRSAAVSRLMNVETMFARRQPAHFGFNA